MANFRTHSSFGMIVGTGITLFSYLNDLIQDYLILLLVFVSAIIGSFLPDLDSDSGIPFRIIFGTSSLLGAVLIFIVIFQKDSTNYKDLILAPISIYIIIRYIVGFIFKKFTHHRGIFHSIPAMLISFVGTLHFLNFYNINLLTKTIISISVFLGFFSHLLLDEIYSATNFQGIPFVPKKSLGSCLEFISKSKVATTIAYSILGVLIYLNYGILLQIYEMIM